MSEIITGNELKISENHKTNMNFWDSFIQECFRVSNLAQNAHSVLEDIDKEFEYKTKLTYKDQIVLWAVAVPAQLARIWIINYLTQIQIAGQSRLESNLKELQGDIFDKFDKGVYSEGWNYYAPKNQILTTAGVPYDTCRYFDKNYNLLNGGHRVSTLGHDPILGLIFGTGNIMTNTITCRADGAFSDKIGMKLITTNHVVYGTDYSNPMIGNFGLTGIMLSKMVERTINEPEVFVASLIKQLIHIGTDMYTPMGIQLPLESLVLDKSYVSELTRIIGWGDVNKISSQAAIAYLINVAVSLIHTLLYDSEKDYSRSLYACRTNNVVAISNEIASLSNLSWVAGNCFGGNWASLKNLDLGGLMVMIGRIQYDEKYRNELKRQYVTENFKRHIRGDESI